MNIKKTFLALAITIFMVFSLSLTISESFAYWSSGLGADSAVNSDVTVTVGTWTFVAPWDSGTSYAIGDQVTHNGTTYQAKKNNPTKEPGVSSGWKSEWTVV